eukprot:TRINITY_DN6641_c0_g2_i2.p1 TRINITY_DN6641_c0_g2~~TRINITY_DN6641_c0_g2_i2.p1  ORF type:complete len:366 (+),score=30.19 TRINITY_DN6641_c0_g2_i2:114-1100(+)
MLSTVSFLPTKPSKQPLFGPRHFVVGTGDFFRTPIKGSAISCCLKPGIKAKVVSAIPKLGSLEQISSPRGPQDVTALEQQSISEDSSSISSIEEVDSVYEEQESLSEQINSVVKPSTYVSQEMLDVEGFQDPDLAVNYSDDLDFLAEKLLIQEEEHQQLVSKLQGLKNIFKEITSKFQPDYVEDAIKSLGKKTLNKTTIAQVFGMEGELKAFEAKLISLSREVLTAQTQVALGATEVSSFGSGVAFKSERINALGLLNYSTIAKRMVSEINDAQIYYDLLTIWSQDLTKFNHNLCYELSNVESLLADHYNKLRRVKNALCYTSCTSLI